MSTKHIPVYIESGKTYHPDNCAPLEAAASEGKLELVALARGNYPGRKMPRGLLPGLRSIGYWDCAQDQDWGLDWHRNEGLELTFLETGSLSFSLGSKDYALEPDSLTLTRPWQPHRVGDPVITPGRLHWVIIDLGVQQPHQSWIWPDWVIMEKDDLNELTRYLRQNECPVWARARRLRDCFRELAEAVREGQQGHSGSRLIVYLNQLLLLLLDSLRDEQLPLEEELTDARRSVEIFLASLACNVSEPWTVELMAEHCGLGVTRFTHYCRQLTNTTPMQYLNRLRVEVAARRLKEELETSITDIAFDCGFSTSQYFATLFKKLKGATPREWRRSGVV